MRTVKELSSITGISIDVINARIKKGWSLKRTLTTEVNMIRSKSKLYTFHGESKTAKEWAEVKGIKASVIRERLRRGWPIRLALNKPVKHSRRIEKLYTSNGMAKTIPEWSRITGISKNTIRGRVKSGWSFKKALTKGNCSIKLYKLNGEAKSITEWSKISGIKVGTIYLRLRNGWSFRKALNKPSLAINRNKNKGEKAA
jgi:hypothetical protein